jgi:hypothetical protein
VAGLVSPGHDGKLYVAALLPLVLFWCTAPYAMHAHGPGARWRSP